MAVDALEAQNNVSGALSCIQAQLCMQSMVAAITGEVEEGTLSTEIQKAVWDNANKNHAVLQYIPYTKSLGLNHNGTVLYPLEHTVWAQQKRNKWQIVDVATCVAQEQQGLICESNTKAQDISLETEQNVCHFEIQPNEIPETILVLENGCI